jgi:hypothetical protein
MLEVSKSTALEVFSHRFLFGDDGRQMASPIFQAKKSR